MMARIIAAARDLLSDNHVRDGEVELRIALAQAACIGVPAVLIGIGLMAVLP